MKKILTFVLVIFGLLFFTGCSGKSIPSPNTKMIDVSTYKPSTKNGVFYIVRKSDFRGGTVSDTYYVDGKKIGTLGNEGLVYYIVELAPKTYKVLHVIDTIPTATEITSRLKVRAGEKYMYYIQHPRMSRPIPFDEDAIRGGKFLGYQKIER